MVATVTAPYFLLTADYGSEPNALDPFYFACGSLMLKRWFLQQFLPTLVLYYLMSDKPQEAVNDAMQAQVVSPVWHIACYLQAVALSALGMDSEAQAALKEGATLESKRSKAVGQK